MAGSAEEVVLVCLAKCRRTCDQHAEQVTIAFNKDMARSVDDGLDTNLTTLLHIFVSWVQAVFGQQISMKGSFYCE